MKKRIDTRFLAIRRVIYPIPLKVASYPHNTTARLTKEIKNGGKGEASCGVARLPERIGLLNIAHLRS